MKQLSKLFFVTFLLAIALRILLLLWSVPLNINGDQTRYEAWAQVSHVYGITDTYTTKHLSPITINNQPPGTLYLIVGTYETYILVGKIIAKLTHTAAGSILFVNSYLLHFFMRIPSVITDLLMGLLAFLLVTKEKGEKKGILAASLIWFNPVIFYNSSVWGQMDSLNNFFFLASLFLAFRKQYILSIVSFAISLYIKLSLLPLLPFYLVFIFFHSQKNWKNILIGTAISALFVIMATLPLSPSPISWLMTQIPAMSAGELQNITNSAFNFWWMLTCGPLVCPPGTPHVLSRFLGLTLGTWGYILFAIPTIPILFLQIKNPKQFITKQYVFLAFSLVAIALFLFLPKMHDRYLYPLFPLFAIAVALSKNLKLYLFIFCTFTLLHLVNVIYSFYPTYFPAFVFYQVLYNNVFRWSISLFIVVSSAVFFARSFFEFLRKAEVRVSKKRT